MSDDHPLLATLGQRARRIVAAGLPEPPPEVRSTHEPDVAADAVVPTGSEERQPFWLWRSMTFKGGSSVSEQPSQIASAAPVVETAPDIASTGSTPEHDASRPMHEPDAQPEPLAGPRRPRRPSLLDASDPGVNERLVGRLAGVLRGGWASRAALVAGAAALGMLAAGAATVLHEPAYAARAALIVKFGREYVYRPEIDGISGWQPSRMLELVNNEAQILQSRDLHAEVVAALGDTMGSAEGEALGRFEERLSVRAIGDTTIVVLAFEHPDPDYAVRALDELLDRYFARRIELLDSPGGTPASLEALRQQVVGARERLTRFLNENDAWDLDRLRDETVSEVDDAPRTTAIRPVRRPLGGRGSSPDDGDTSMLLSAVEAAEPAPQLGLRDQSAITDGIAERRLAVDAAERAYAFALRRSVEDAVSRSLDSAGASNVAILDRPRVDPDPQGLPVWLRILVGGLLAAAAATALLILRAGRPVAAAPAREA